MLTPSQRFAKRSLDIIVSLIVLILTGWIILLAYIIATIDTKSNGLFIQKRIGKQGKFFSLFKIKTMSAVAGVTTTVTTAIDPRITRSGKFFRKTKIDELPQLINVLIGDMSLVGPRPDVQGYADKLIGDDANILTLRPGITGPATLKYKNEEILLSQENNPKQYNDEIIWPDKVKINRHYLDNWTFFGDIHYLWRTLTS